MQTKLHRTIIILLGSLAIAVLLLGCSFGAEETGTIRLSLTDAPVADAEGIEGVFVTITSISYNLNETWIEDTGFVGPQTFNLLELTGGTVAPLSDTIINAGEVSQIRFMLEAQEVGDSASPSPSTYIVFDSRGTADGIIDEHDVIHELFVPSGSQTGYKTSGSFTIPKNGEVEITADFDVRKSLVKRGISDDYLLKPTIRLVVNHQAGTIAGNFTAGTSAYASYSVFAYADETYADSEAPSGTEDESFIPFANAISSAAVNTEEDSYTLPFLAAGTYDLIIVGVDTDGSYTVIDSSTYQDIVVEPETTTGQDVSLP